MAGNEVRHSVLQSVADSLDSPRGDGVDADRRVRHLAAAAIEPDDAVAAELESAAERARLRGRYAASAAAHERAARLTGESVLRDQRLAAVSEAASDAGHHVSRANDRR